MSEGIPDDVARTIEGARRLQQAVREVLPPRTRYDILVSDAYDSLDRGKTHVHDNAMMSTNELTDYDSYEFSVAEVSATLALAEQQRIANLLTLATVIPPVRFPSDHKAQAKALDDALEALGFPRREDS